jgi:hypothetical protein
VLFIERGANENKDNNSAKGGYYLTDEESALLQTLRTNFARLERLRENVAYILKTMIRFA